MSDTLPDGRPIPDSKKFPSRVSLMINASGFLFIGLLAWVGLSVEGIFAILLPFFAGAAAVAFIRPGWIVDRRRRTFSRYWAVHFFFIFDIPFYESPIDIDDIVAVRQFREDRRVQSQGRFRVCAFYPVEIVTRSKPIRITESTVDSMTRGYAEEIAAMLGVPCRHN